MDVVQLVENGTLAEPPDCWVKTQFGSVAGHVAVVELFSYLKREFFPDLNVTDESGYWEDRDLKKLIDKFAQMRGVIDAMAAGLRASPLSAEAAEDPAIVAARVERMARQVYPAIARLPEHAPVRFDDGLDWDEFDEAHWDASYKELRRKQERLHRAIEEQLRSGSDHDEAFENAMRSEGIIDLPGEPDEEEFEQEAGGFEAEGDDESWRGSLPGESDRDRDWIGDDASHDAPFDTSEREQHPLQQLASDLRVRVFQLLEDADDNGSSHGGMLMHAVGEIGGGLAQALSPRATELDGLNRGLARWGVARTRRRLGCRAFSQVKSRKSSINPQD
jgi:hypothetical protein